MQSPRHVEAMVIDEALVVRLLHEQFPHWAALPVRRVVPGGWDNRTFRLGEDMLARLPAHAVYAPQVAVEQHWLPRLAAHLPLAIPQPLAAGVPGCGYPLPWSIYRWLPGDTADAMTSDEPELAQSLAAFVRALHACDTTGAPLPGEANFQRGGTLAGYDAQARDAIAALADRIDAGTGVAFWEEALASAWDAPPVWVHGDLWLTNLLVTDGRLSAVIDWGLMAAGDPACDLAIAWRGFGLSGRAALREHLPMDPGTWARARGWALWKLAITATGMSGRKSEAAPSLAALRGLLTEA